MHMNTHLPPAAKPIGVSLVVRRTIKAPPERVFAAWTRPEYIMVWWGPATVTCPHAEVDLRIGGRYRIANRFPDGKEVWIEGEFEHIEAPRHIVYSWRLEGGQSLSERVSVRFERRPADSTEVIVTHERIPDQAIRDLHEQGWNGCLDGLEAYFQ